MHVLPEALPSPTRLAAWNGAALANAPFDVVCYPEVSERLGTLAACETAILELHSRLPASPCADGCADPAWRQLVGRFVVSRGCIPCLSVGIDWKLMPREGCIAGQVALQLTRMLDTVNRWPARFRWHAELVAAPFAEKAQVLAEFCTDEVLLPLLGISVAQVKYLVLQHFNNFTQPRAEQANDHTANKYVFDIGMATGGDSLYYLQQGFNVVAVESDASRVAFVRKCCSHPRLHMLETAIDMPRTGTTCGEIINHFGTPYYMKVDIEMMDLVCLATLSPESELPEFLSVELVTWESFRDKTLQQTLLRRLQSLGYTRFKLVRQHLYNLLIRYEEGAMPVWPASGPFGDEAVDFRTGNTWRDASSIMLELDSTLLVEDLLWHNEWYDLHAAK